jgi:hypothetical protein
VVTLLPDREPATAQAWLAAHPTISVVARDRGGGYGEAAAKTPQTEKEPLSLSLRKRLGQLQGRLAVDQVRPQPATGQIPEIEIHG